VKSYFLFIALIFVFALPASKVSAQGDRFKTDSKNQSGKHNPTEHFKKIEAIKASYITRRMDLTPEESQRFWPVYNQYQKELTQILIQKRQNMHQSQEDPEKRLNTDIEYENKLLLLRKKYKNEFLKVLSAEKVSLLMRCEREFKEELIQQLKNRKEK
jgi:Spy/CpxP family protein refolding chaperone